MAVTRLLTFTISNYRSFYSPQMLDLRNEDGSQRPLTVIYGPNSSGKSNSAYALQDFRACIVNSANANWKLPYSPFMLRVGATGSPTKFGAEFLVDGRRYIYAFSFVSDKIVSEELRQESSDTGRMNLVFRRDENGITSKSAGQHGFGRLLEKKTRRETLLITKAHEDNNPFSEALFNLVESTVVVLDRDSDFSPQFVDMLKGNENLKTKILDLLRNCDFNIRDIAIGETSVPDDLIASLPLPREIKQALTASNATTFSALHAIRDDELSIVGMGAMDFWSQESNGTRKFFEAAVPIVNALENGSTLYLDEFGAYLHPNLSKALVSLFKGNENKNEASLIVNTQNTSLMEGCAQRDDVVLVEKDLGEESRIVALKDRGARTTEPLADRYLRGLYGGVPRIRER